MLVIAEKPNIMASNGERGGPSEWLLTWIWDYPNFFFNSRSPVRRFSPFELNRISCSMRNIRLLLHPGFSSGRSLVRNVGGFNGPLSATCTFWTDKSAGRSLTLFSSQTPRQLTQPGAVLAATTARGRRNRRPAEILVTGQK